MRQAKASAASAQVTRFYNGHMRNVCWILAMIATGVPAIYGQTPQPFPRPGAEPTRTVAAPSPIQPPPPSTAATIPARQAPVPPQPSPEPSLSPTTAVPPNLNVPLYPAAQFLASYDAGRGQRYYLFGSTASFADLVAYYRTQLRDRGTLVFEEPAAHMFEVGRFRDDAMAFPPSVTIKDWTFGGSQGYPNPRRGGQPERFPTVIVVVPPTAPATP